MTTEITFADTVSESHRWEHTTLAHQKAAFDAAARIAELHPELPGAYFTLSYVTPDQIDVQAQTFAALEAWREALSVPPSAVVPGNCAPERHHLEFETVVGEMPVRVYVMGDLVSAVAA